MDGDTRFNLNAKSTKQRIDLDETTRSAESSASEENPGYGRAVPRSRPQNIYHNNLIYTPPNASQLADRKIGLLEKLIYKSTSDQQEEESTGSESEKKRTEFYALHSQPTKDTGAAIAYGTEVFAETEHSDDLTDVREKKYKEKKVVHIHQKRQQQKESRSQSERITTIEKRMRSTHPNPLLPKTSTTPTATNFCKSEALDITNRNKLNKNQRTLSTQVSSAPSSTKSNTPPHPFTNALKLARDQQNRLISETLKDSLMTNPPRIRANSFVYLKQIGEWAIENKQSEVLKAALDTEAETSANSYIIFGAALLNTASSSGWLEGVQLLVRYNIYFSEFDKTKIGYKCVIPQAIENSIEHNHIEITEFLLKEDHRYRETHTLNNDVPIRKTLSKKDKHELLDKALSKKNDAAVDLINLDAFLQKDRLAKSKDLSSNLNHKRIFYLLINVLHSNKIKQYCIEHKVSELSAERLQIIYSKHQEVMAWLQKDSVLVLQDTEFEFMCFAALLMVHFSVVLSKSNQDSELPLDYQSFSKDIKEHLLSLHYLEIEKIRNTAENYLIEHFYSRFDALLPFCVKYIEAKNTSTNISLQTRLINDFLLLKPVAQLIIRALTGAKFNKDSDITEVYFLFSNALLESMDKHRYLTYLSNSDDTPDEIHTIFNVQNDALRQYAERLLELSKNRKTTRSSALEIPSQAENDFEF